MTERHLPETQPGCLTGCPLLLKIWLFLLTVMNGLIIGVVGWTWITGAK